MNKLPSNELPHNDLPTARSYWDWHCRHYGDIDWVQRANEQRSIESFIGVP